VRLDIFLKLSRLCPRRSVAQQLCDAGFIFLNGRPAKPAHVVKAEDRIVIRTRGVETVVRVLRVPEVQNVSRREAKDLIEVLSSRRQV